MSFVSLTTQRRDQVLLWINKVLSGLNSEFQTQFSFFNDAQAKKLEVLLGYPVHASHLSRPARVYPNT
jgi:hypothetical protein